MTPVSEVFWSLLPFLLLLVVVGAVVGVLVVRSRRR